MEKETKEKVEDVKEETVEIKKEDKKEEEGFATASRILIVITLIVVCLTILSVATVFFMRLGERLNPNEPRQPQFKINVKKNN